MSGVDGCVLLVCSGANGRFRPLADWTDQTAPKASVPAWSTGARHQRPVGSRGGQGRYGAGNPPRCRSVRAFSNAWEGLEIVTPRRGGQSAETRAGHGPIMTCAETWPHLRSGLAVEVAGVEVLGHLLLIPVGAVGGDGLGELPHRVAKLGEALEGDHLCTRPCGRRRQRSAAVLCLSGRAGRAGFRTIHSWRTNLCVRLPVAYAGSRRHPACSSRSSSSACPPWHYIRKRHRVA